MKKLLDSNVWIALCIANHTFHHASNAWISSVNQPRDLLFCRSTQQSLLRLLTTDKLFLPLGNSALSNSEAWEIYERFLSDHRVVFVDEPHGIEAHWKKLTNRTNASPKLWMDAYLAAFAITGKYQLVSTDNAFTQFADLNFHLIK